MLRAQFDMSVYGEYAVSCPDPALRLTGGNEMPIWYLLVPVIQLRLKMLTAGVWFVRSKCELTIPVRG